MPSNSECVNATGGETVVLIFDVRSEFVFGQTFKPVHLHLLLFLSFVHLLLLLPFVEVPTSGIADEDQLLVIVADEVGDQLGYFVADHLVEKHVSDQQNVARSSQLLTNTGGRSSSSIQEISGGELPVAAVEVDVEADVQAGGCQGVKVDVVGDAALAAGHQGSDRSRATSATKSKTLLSLTNWGKFRMCRHKT